MTMLTSTLESLAAPGGTGLSIGIEHQTVDNSSPSLAIWLRVGLTSKDEAMGATKACLEKLLSEITSVVSTLATMNVITVDGPCVIDIRRISVPTRAEDQVLNVLSGFHAKVEEAIKVVTAHRLDGPSSLSRGSGQPQGSSGGLRKNCRRCRKQFASVNLLNYHISTVHQSAAEHENPVESSQLPFFCCQECYKSCLELSTFREHECSSSRHGLEATSPGSPIASGELLREHNRFVCSLCNEEFRHFDRILHHLHKCKGPPFTCELCDRHFSLRKELMAHKTDNHVAERPFRCDECPDKWFKLNSSLQKHLISHHEKAASIPTSSFECDKCGKRFIKKVYLTNHQSRFHCLFKKYLCQVCGARFVSSSSLNMHIAQLHEKSGNEYVCSECGQSFGRKDRLECHFLAKHSNSRPHTCSVCKKGFALKAKMKEHMQRHLGIKRLCCLKCDKMFSGSSELRRHLLRFHPSHKVAANIPLPPQIINIPSVQGRNSDV